MKQRSKLITALKLAVLVIFSSGCNAQSTLSPVATATQGQVTTLTNTTSPVHTPTARSTFIPAATSTSTLATTTTPPGDGPGRIAYVGWDGFDLKSCDIFVMDLDGSDPIQMTKNSAWDTTPTWSPDGTQIAFVSDRDGNAEIYVMNADGSDQTQLTTQNKFDLEPAWSPNGTKIAFESDRDGQSEIYVMNADGTDPMRLTDNGNINSQPAWSPDGSKIAFVSSESVGGSEEIHVMNADGSSPIRLTNNGWQDLHPAWSPDGMKIAFENNGGHNIDIYVMNADGSSVTRLTHDDAWDHTPVWSPDGAEIAFVSNRNDSFGIYRMNADGSNETLLRSNAGSLDWLHGTQDPVIQLSDCTSGWTRLAAGQRAKVSEATSTPNRVRSGPSQADTAMTLLFPGSILKILEGPVCADGLIFWKVENDLITGGVGWTAEGDGKEYWLEPYNP